MHLRLFGVYIWLYIGILLWFALTVVLHPLLEVFPTTLRVVVRCIGLNKVDQLSVTCLESWSVESLISDLCLLWSRVERKTGKYCWFLCCSWWRVWGWFSFLVSSHCFSFAVLKQFRLLCWSRRILLANCVVGSQLQHNCLCTTVSGGICYISVYEWVET